MELRPGYKQSEMGLIPEDWEVVNLGSLSKISSGGTPSREMPEYWNGGIPWVTTTEVDYRRIDETIETISESGLRASAAKLLSPGTILMAIYGQGKTRGKIARLGIEACSNQACAAIHVKGSFSNEYVYQYLASAYDDIRRLSNTGSQENLTKGIVASIPIRLPNSALEQDAIAEALNTADAQIESLEQLLAKKRRIKQGAMQGLLTGKMRLLGFSGAWRTRQLGEVVARCSSGATPYRGRTEFYKGTVKWITSGELNYNIIEDTIEHISQEAVLKTNLTTHPVGTFLMAITGLEAVGTRGACGIVGNPATTNQSCMAIYPTGELKTEYLFHYYVHRGNELALEYCQGTKQQSYTAKLVKLLPIDLPPSTEEQAAIATVLSDMDAEVAALQAKLAKARQFKQGMMQELLTGRIRLV
jgi:type I restriction enzyme S subunit